MRYLSLLVFSLFVLSTGVNSYGKDLYTLDKEHSTFAILTKRGGIASGLAHDHLIVAKSVQGSVIYDKKDPSKSVGSIQIAADKLMVDENGGQEKNADLLKAGSLEVQNKGISDSERAEITEHMLDASQLNAKTFPEITGALSEVLIKGDKGLAQLSVTIRGKTQKLPVEFIIKEEADTVKITMVKETSFSAFDIEPYSALLGAVRNKDQFYIMLDLKMN